jgi:uncharacterized membrane protein YphA (DoxX/SURF4 family)
MTKLSFKHSPALALLLVRSAVAIVFIAHGWAKLANLAGTVNFFQSIGLPSSLAYIVAVIEFAGGLALLAGLWPRVMAGLLAAIMIGAIATVKFKLGFLGGYEFEFLLLAAAVGLLVTDPTRYGWRQR